jgi:hypothetical protein
VNVSCSLLNSNAVDDDHIMGAVNALLHAMSGGAACRSLSEIITLALKGKGANKGVFSILNHLGLCFSYDTSINRMYESAQALRAERADMARFLNVIYSFDNLDWENQKEYWYLFNPLKWFHRQYNQYKNTDT